LLCRATGKFGSGANNRQRYGQGAKNIPNEREELVLWNYFSDTGQRSPRYYQVAAINKTLEAISRGQSRILYLADRNILINQTMVNDFKPVKGAMAQLSPEQKGVERLSAIALAEEAAERPGEPQYRKLVDQSYEIYLPIPGGVGHRRGAEHLQAVQARLLRPHRRR
jgi:type I site-specific restriction endonuclease